MIRSRRLRLSLAMMLISSSICSQHNTTQLSRRLQQQSSGTSTIDSEYYSSLQGRLSLMRRCEASVVYVHRMYLTCDSPGDYYYGSGGYRKSSRCKYGDKANMYIFCKFEMRLTISAVAVCVLLLFHAIFHQFVEDSTLTAGTIHQYSHDK